MLQVELASWHALVASRGSRGTNWDAAQDTGLRTDHVCLAGVNGRPRPSERPFAVWRKFPALARGLSGALLVPSRKMLDRALVVSASLLVAGLAIVACSGEEEPGIAGETDGGGADVAASDASSTGDGAGDATTADATSADSANPADAGTDVQDAAFTVAPLGVYTIGVDGGGLTLLIDAGTREISHMRLGPGGWIAATRYGQDPDGNGLSMENEDGFGAYYGGTEIIVFQRSAPYAQTVITGSPAGGIAANASWTADDKLLYLVNAPDAGVVNVHLERASFGSIPNVTSTAVVPVPAPLLVPVDPHQHGPSDGTGFITFTAMIEYQAKWMRPLWRMPATGTAVFAQASLVGCPICPAQGGCCGFGNVADVLGTNDSRISHSGGDVLWMQQHPNITATVGPITVSPFRQVRRPLDGGAQVDLIPAGTDPLTSHAYGEWRADDREIVYWSIEVQAGVGRNFLWVMKPDGSDRRPIPLPPGMCPQHPSYLSDTEIIFDAWRGAAPDGSCDVSHL